ncbi:hypothetical protein HCN44_000949 [Aphidius gifuensis]|uniref:Uncharacterized protein n=1 Tax=Aphidius gifuensis TaxID=684658 RepID=A0A834XKA7_APHGI|nr:hypothetical protein HCN44_000949 [Aphidius gifuensis]
METSKGLTNIKNRSFWKNNLRNERLIYPDEIVNETLLKNGMKLFCEEKNANTTIVGCFLSAGSIYEQENERGASLFMEHLIFNKTKNMMAEDIENQLANIGGKFSAIAMRDVFILYGIAPSLNVEKIISMLAEFLFNGLICDDDVEKVKPVILQRLNEMENNHEQVVMDYLSSIAYQGTLLGKSIYPTTCEIKNITEEQINSFKNRLFKSSNMTIITTGGTAIEEVQCLADHYFYDEIKNCNNTDPCLTVCPDEVYPKCMSFRFTGSDMRVRDDDNNFGHVAIAIEGPGYENSNDHFALNIAKEIVGEWNLGNSGGHNNCHNVAQWSSKFELCHLYKSFNIAYNCTSLWGCYFVSEKLKIEDMINIIQKEWMRLCTSLTSHELTRAINNYKTKKLIIINDPVGRFFDLTNCIYRNGKYETICQRLERYENINADVLCDVADKYIYDKCPAVVGLGSVENLPDYNLIRSSMYLLRR